MSTYSVHQVPVEHDTKLLSLLLAVVRARQELAAIELRVMQAATTVRVTYNGYCLGVPDPKRPGRDKTMLKGELPDGTLYYQSKTFQRGEEGYWFAGTRTVKRDGEDLTYFSPRRASFIDVLELAVNDPELVPEGMLNAHEAAMEVLDAANAAVRQHEEAYTGWNRYFLVTSSAGHVHRSMSCSSCFPSTTYAPVVSLSGKSDAEAVEELGSTLCTVCFPDAPVEGKVRKITKAQAAKLIVGA